MRVDERQLALKTLEKIANTLDGIDMNDMTKAEYDIAGILIETGFGVMDMGNIDIVFKKTP